MTPATILAATFTIAFEGLMMLHHPSGNAHLAVVNEPVHHNTPHIYIYHDGNRPRTEILINHHDRITFSNTRRGRVKVDDLFREHIPTLNSYLVRGHVRDNVTEEVFRDDDGVLAYVDLPKGSVTTWHNFADAVQLTRNGQPEIVCMARFGVLGPVPVPALSVELQFDPPRVEHYPIEPGDVVIISNISQDTERLHFPDYSKLLNQDGLMGAMRVLYGGCDKDEESDTVDPAVGRILNNHSPTPNGDCGSVGNP